MFYDYEVADFMETSQYWFSPRTKHFKGGNQLLFRKIENICQFTLHLLASTAAHYLLTRVREGGGRRNVTSLEQHQVREQ